MPILNYGSEVWGFTQADAVEQIHLQFCKTIIGDKEKIHRMIFIYGETWQNQFSNETLSFDHKVLVLRYYQPVKLNM